MATRIIMKTLLKKIFLALFTLLFLCGTVFAKKKKSEPTPKFAAPIWTTDEGRLEAFPQSEYISALGVGYSETQAKSKAAADIATFFKAQVKSDSEFKSVMKESGGSTQKTRSVEQDIKVSSQEELYALDYTAVWQNERTAQYYCVAFIDRAECWKRIEPKLSAIKQNVAQKRSLAQSRSDALLKVLALALIQSDREESQKLYDFGNVVAAQKCSAYSETQAAFVSAQNECAKLKPSVSIVVNVTGDNSGIAARKIAWLLENAGCTVSEGSAAYVAQAKCSVKVEEQADAFTSRPGIQIDLYKMRGGKTIVSYNKTCPKSAGFDKDGAFRAAYKSIENELEQSFIREIVFAK